MKTGLVNPSGYSSTYPTNMLSPAVWDTCQGSDLNDLAKGLFFFDHYANGFHPASLVFTDALSTAVSGQAYYNSVFSTVYTNNNSTLYPNAVGHLIELTAGSTNQASFLGRVAITSRPVGTVTPGGLPVWFETALTITTASTQECGMFVGLVTLPALSTAATVGSGCILSTITAVASTNKLAPSTGAIGFWMHGDTPNNFDCVYQNQYGSGAYSTSTGVNVVLANALTSSTGAIVPGTYATAPVGGPITPIGILASTGVQKLGIKYLPQVGQVQWYVNGYQVAAAAVTPANSTTGTGFDVTDAYGGIVVLGSSTSTTQAIVDFFAVAGQQLL